ncbi:hypothetical protein WOLCODRAFT_150438 [Wolfiporia cocos MD-104 SS10]|uniref:Uncharacterized protein n=1 Tax=Wolfiporia cocos (strain MD-104) TaxID=742152 RepID=A0A2H3JKM6_WOLCO|nr:hypothetical protein WOLCODRAFT_150438 [Wolfiporia cocos MD-104 SS10]
MSTVARCDRERGGTVHATATVVNPETTRNTVEARAKSNGKPPRSTQQGPPTQIRQAAKGRLWATRANRSPKAHPVAIATATKPEHRARTRTSPQRQQAPPLCNRLKNRQSRARQRVAPKQVTAPNVQPPPVEQWCRHYKNVPLPSAAPNKARSRQAIRRQGKGSQRKTRSTPATDPPPPRESHRPPKVNRTPTGKNVSTGTSHSSTTDGQGRQSQNGNPPPVHKSRPKRPEHARHPLGEAQQKQTTTAAAHATATATRPRHAYTGQHVQGGPPLKSPGYHLQVRR